MNNDEHLVKISKNVLSILEHYNRLCRNSHKDLGSLFWDAVIISSSDESQEKGYKLQIEEKQHRGDLPSTVPFYVWSDPPDCKVGCGVSSMHTIEKLYDIYASSMYKMRFLFIPAGGFSQRLPNLTVLGKLFSPLPFGENRYQMIDLILATYLPFLKNMPPGVFLSASDAIIGFSYNDNDNWTFKNEGFTALAHPSPTSVGTAHGVYVLPPEVHVPGNSSFMSECLRVLQKPNVEEMREKHAIVKHISGTGDNEEIVFSDSAFFFDHSISEKLLRFYRQNKPIMCELSSFGDFLQPLGSCATPSYIADKITSEELATVRSALYQELHGTKLSVLVLMESSFHHLGTMEQYIESLTGNNSFAKIFPVCKRSFCSFSVRVLPPTNVDGCVVHSVFHPLSVLPDASVVEYCDVNVRMEVGRNCIISNVTLEGVAVQCFPLPVPDDTLLHTVILREGFVTVAFNIREDIKEKKKRENAMDVLYFGKKLGLYLEVEGGVFPDVDEVSLWEAKLFPVCHTARDSLMRTLGMVLCILECDPTNPNYVINRTCDEWISMQDVLSRKNTQAMVDYQKVLYEKISRQKNS